MFFLTFGSFLPTLFHTAAAATHAEMTKNSHQVHLVGPLEVVLHRPIVQTDPGVVVAQAWNQYNKSR